MERKKVYTLRSLRYGVTNTFSTWISMIAQTYWAIFLTDAVGFDTGRMAAIISIASIADMVSIPIIGVTMQKAEFKSGKFRPWLMIGGVGAALFRVLSFSNPNMSVAAKGIWFCAAYIICNVFYNLAYSAFVGILPLMASNRDDRQAYSASKNICNSIGKFLFSLSSLKLIALFGQGNDANGYLLFSIMTAAFAIFAFVQLSFMAKSVDVVDTKKSDATGKKISDGSDVSLWEMIKYTITKPFLLFILGTTCKTTAYSIIIGLAAYYYTYVVGDASMLTVYLSSSTFVMIFGSYLAPYITKAIDSSKNSYALGLGIYGSCLALAFFLGKSSIAFTIFLSIGYAGYSMAHTTEITQYSGIVDYAQWKSGKDLKPFMMSIFNIIPKIGTTIGNIVLGYGLVAVGFNKENITEAATKGIRMIFSALPAAILFVGVVVFLLYPLTDEKVKKMQEDIESWK